MSIKGKRAFITGCYGQDGSYLAEYLLDQDYSVLGLIREEDTLRSKEFKFSDDDDFSVVVGDVTDLNSFQGELKAFDPTEVYALAAISDLGTARKYPELTMTVNYGSAKELIDLLYVHNKETRLFVALSSRLLKPNEKWQISEASDLNEPSNAYDEAKRKLLEEVIIPYREKGLFISSGYLCNHESPRRDGRFVSGKIARVVADIGQGKEDVLIVGNIEAKRDWSFAGDLVRAMHASLQTTKPTDYVIGSGTLHSVKEFINIAFATIGMQITWEGERMDARAYDDRGILRVAVESDFYRADDNPVVSVIEKIQRDTGWKPEVSFEDLVRMMVQYHL